MAIDITDYTSRLNSARNEYSRKADELNRNYKRNVKSLEDTHRYRTDSQRKAYDNQLSDIEENVGELNDDMRAETKKNLQKD